MTVEQELTRLLATYAVETGLDCKKTLLSFLNLLEKWNRRVNLVSSTSWSILGPLFEEGLWASRFYPQKPTYHLDIGSGAGFPALPLRILNPLMQLQMVESRTKRAVFLETAVTALGLTEVRVSCHTLQELLCDTSVPGGWDHVSWKAVRIDRKCLELLIKRTAARTSFWVFHGEELPIEGGDSDLPLRLTSRHKAPCKSSWYLSIFKNLSAK